MIDRLAVQTFTVRKQIQTPAEIKKIFTDLFNSGYKRFELARMKYNRPELDVLKELQEELGLEYVTCQIKLDVILKRFDWLMEFSTRLNIPTLEVSVIPTGAFLKGKKGMLELADKLNMLGRRTKEHGVGLLFHHHNFELFKMNDKLGIEHLIDNTDPELVNFVSDTYWLARSGFNPAAFIGKHVDRIRGVHIRDCEFIRKGFSFSFRDQRAGAGSVDFKPFCSSRYLSIDFFSVEQDSENPLEDLKKSYIYLKNL